MPLQPLPYHRALVAHLKAHLPAVWQHFASESFQVEHENAVRLHLLQTTFELKRDSHPELYAAVDSITETLELGAQVELYQGDGGESLNAELLYLPHTARIVFYGPLQERLDPDELRSLIGHELAHHRLWTLDHGDYRIADQALRGLVSLASSGSALEALRLLNLSTEVFADRAGMLASNLDASVRTLIKVRTNLSRANAPDFLAQSEELLAAQGTGSRGWTHPDAHIRALALRRFHDAGALADGEIRALIEGPIQLDELDLIRRLELSELTERLVGHLLAPSWFHTDAVLGHTRLLFDDDVPEAGLLTEADRLLAPWGDTVRDYLVAILLDYVAVDPELEDLPLARAHLVAEQLGLEAELLKAVNQKLKRRKRDLETAIRGRDALLAAAEVAQ